MLLKRIKLPAHNQTKPPIVAYFWTITKTCMRVSSGFCQNTLLLLVFSFALIQIWPHFASLFKLVDFYLGELSL